MRATLALIFFALALVFLTAFTGNSDAVDPAVIQDTAALTMALGDQVVGQTFVARTARLHALQVRFIVPNDLRAPPAGRVTLHLRRSPAAERDLASASIPLDQIRNNEFARFSFAPLTDSKDQSYYFFFDAPAEQLALWSSGEDEYAGGALHENGNAARRDLAFRAFYDPDLGMLLEALARLLAQFSFPVAVFASFVLTLAYLTWRPLTPVILLALITALVQFRDLPAPLWVDSLTHAQSVQFILAQARLPLSTFYHLGFHVLTALAAKLFDLSVPHAILLVGQFTWVLVGVSVFFFSRRICNSAIAGLVSAVCVWFLSPTPAYFVTWGRYPLVLGSALLPIALLYTISSTLFTDGGGRRGGLFLAAITLMALAFSHIRLTAFYFAFVAVYWILSRRKMSPLKPSKFLGSLALTLFLLFFWLAALYVNGATLQSIFAQNQAAPEIDVATAFDVLQTHHGIAFYFLAALAAVFGIARRSRVTLLALGWLILLSALAFVPPVVGALVPLSLVALMAFLPAALILGDAAQLAYERSRAAPRIVHAGIWIGLIGWVGLIGARGMVNLANPATILFTRADANAMEWINANVPRDASAKFLVNSFNWVGATYLPSDGGGWIPFFAENKIDYLDASAGDSPAALAQWIASRQIRYVYLGTRAGTLHASDFLTPPERFSLLYDFEGVKILGVK